jgi:hypothetical protein
MRSAIIGATILLGLGNAAGADEILAGGNLFGGPLQSRVVCLFYNAGGANVRLTSFEIADQFGTPMPLVIDQCTAVNSRIRPGRTCGIAADITNQFSFSCRATMADKQNMRGVLDIRDADQHVLANTQLR